MRSLRTFMHAEHTGVSALVWYDTYRQLTGELMDAVLGARTAGIPSMSSTTVCETPLPPTCDLAESDADLHQRYREALRTPSSPCQASAEDICAAGADIPSSAQTRVLVL